MLALHDRIFVVQQWCLLRSATAVRRSFRNRDPRYHGKNLPSLQSIRNVINHFKAHGTVTDLRKTTAANKKRQIPEEDVRSVKRLYYWKQRFSVKRASVKTGLSRYRVRKNLKVAGFTARPSLCKTEPPLIQHIRQELFWTLISGIVWLENISTGPGHPDHQIWLRLTSFYGLLSSGICTHPQMHSNQSVLWRKLLHITIVYNHASTETF